MSKLFVEPNAYRLESTLQTLVKSYNDRRQAILNRYGVSEQDVDIIRHLDEEDQKKMKEVGEFFQIKLSTLTSTVDNLEKGKLVKRKNSKEDRRVIYIHPTPKGKNLLSELDDPGKIVAQNIIGQFKADQFQTIMTALEQMINDLKG
ncbi:MAG: MarR family transcriptional regulator [Bacteroidia bacterium]|nr:MarR family transcriptional regulator [Bacteroidia bacterium]